MIKNITVLVTIATLFFACKPNLSEPETEVVQQRDSTIVGVDKDENGCLASAGYTWSKLNKECVKAFTGIQLNPADNLKTEDVTLCAYVLFNEAGDKAELFFPDEKSMILTKNQNSKSWIFNEYQLVPENGYVLKKDGVVIFSGDGEIGNKVTGSDNPEGQE